MCACGLDGSVFGCGQPVPRDARHARVRPVYRCDYPSQNLRRPPRHPQRHLPLHVDVQLRCKPPPATHLILLFLPLVIFYHPMQRKLPSWNVSSRITSPREPTGDCLSCYVGSPHATASHSHLYSLLGTIMPGLSHHARSLMLESRPVPFHGTTPGPSWLLVLHPDRHWLLFLPSHRARPLLVEAPAHSTLVFRLSSRSPPPPIPFNVCLNMLSRDDAFPQPHTYTHTRPLIFPH